MTNKPYLMIAFDNIHKGDVVDVDMVLGRVCLHDMSEPQICGYKSHTILIDDDIDEQSIRSEGPGIVFQWFEKPLFITEEQQMKLAELLEDAKKQIAKEKEEIAVEVLKERVREVEATEKLLRTQKRQLEELLNKDVDDVEDF